MPDEVIDQLNIEGENAEQQSKEAAANDTTETVDTEETPDDDSEFKRYAEFVESAGGEESLKQAKALYDLYAGDPSEFDPKKFWSQLAETSERRYDAVAMDLFNTHKDFFMKEVLGIDPTLYRQYREWDAAGRPTGTKVDGGPTDEELEASTDPRDKELLENRKWRREQERVAQERNKETQVERERQYRTYVTNETQQFDAGRDARISEDVKKLNLGTDGVGQKAAFAIEAMAKLSFAKDPQSAKLYRAALDHIESGEPKLAANLSTPIDVRLGKHTADAVQFISELLQAKRELEQLKGKTITGRKEVAQGGAAVPATLRRTDSEPFELKDQLARYRELKAQGRV